MPRQGRVAFGDQRSEFRAIWEVAELVDLDRSSSVLEVRQAVDTMQRYIAETDLVCEIVASTKEEGQRRVVFLIGG